MYRVRSLCLKNETFTNTISTLPMKSGANTNARRTFHSSVYGEILQTSPHA